MIFKGRVKKNLYKKSGIFHTGVLRRVVHGRHSRRLFRSGSLLQSVVDERCETVLHVGLDHIRIKRIIDTNILSSSNNF